MITNPHHKAVVGKPRISRKATPVDETRFAAEVRAYFDQRRSRLKVVKTTRTPSGQIVDWVPIESQVPDGKIASPPPNAALVIPQGERRHMLVKFELEDKAVERGPSGTVPILAKDFSKLHISRSLRDYLSRHGHARQRLLELKNGLMLPDPEEGGTHRYAFTSQSTLCFGGEGNLSAFDPYTESSDDFSLMQIGLSNSDTGRKQTVEGGWQEFQDEYGDWVPHLFTYYTTNGYSDDGDNKGGYNQDVDGWVQYDGSIHPGATSSPNSTPGGGQYIMQIKYQWYESNWWFRVNGRWIGYYPGSLFMGNQSVFSTLGDHADHIAFWGEVYDSDDVDGRTTTDMGSGYWAEDGWTWSAYQSNLRVQTDRGGSLADYDGGSGWASDPDMYDITTFMKSGSGWGSYFWMGGPGAG
jgi:hypothetical protein